MQEYTIQRSTRKCHQENRSFEPNERYYSLVFQKGSELVRQDIGKEHWHGPPENTVGWWVSHMPAKRTGKLTLAPTYILLDALEKLGEQPENGDLAYLLAILLVRRRILTEPTGDSLGEDASHLHLVQPGDGREFVIPIHQPDASRAEYLHQKLVDLLYSDS
jgi:hypothetical protein